MKLYIFRCRTRTRKYGATRYETGSNLPTDQCSGVWEFYERVELGARGTVRFAVDTTTLLSHIKRNGWYVWDESAPREPRRSAAAERKLLSREQDPPLPERETAGAAPAIASAPMTGMAVSTPADVVLERRQVVPEDRPVEVANAPEAGFPRSEATLPADQHQVVWFDIPVRDLDRALRFYSAVLGAELEKEQTGPGVAMAMLPHADGFVSGCLLQSADARPSEGGPLLYLNTHGRLDEALNAVEKHGGRVLLARHSIAPFGFRAIVVDSEGNRLALHSSS